jgi:hypothetical protein
MGSLRYLKQAKDKAAKKKEGYIIYGKKEKAAEGKGPLVVTTIKGASVIPRSLTGKPAMEPPGRQTLPAVTRTLTPQTEIAQKGLPQAGALKSTLFKRMESERQVQEVQPVAGRAPAVLPRVVPNQRIAAKMEEFKKLTFNELSKRLDESVPMTEAQKKEFEALGQEVEKGLTPEGPNEQAKEALKKGSELSWRIHNERVLALAKREASIEEEDKVLAEWRKKRQKELEEQLKKG